jgi:hypothetical protein
LDNDAQQRHYTYRELFRMHMDHRQIHAIREALNQELVLGREDFKSMWAYSIAPPPLETTVQLSKEGKKGQIIFLHIMMETSCLEEVTH